MVASFSLLVDMLVFFEKGRICASRYRYFWYPIGMTGVRMNVRLNRMIESSPPQAIRGHLHTAAVLEDAVAPEEYCGIA